MAGNQKQRRKKKKTSSGPTAPAPKRRRMGASQIVFIALGVLIILSMVISLVTNFSF